MSPSHTNHVLNLAHLQCWCTKTLTDHGDSSACDYECVSNAGEMCGGFDALSVYAIGSDVVAPSPVTAPTPSPVATPSPVTPEPTPEVSGDGFVSVGCRLDARDDRIMGSWAAFVSTMSAEVSEHTFVIVVTACVC